MSLRNWFASKRNLNTASLNPEGINDKLSDEEIERLWIQCYNCNERLPRKDIEENLMVCTGCGYHFRIGAWDRIRHLTDAFTELDSGLRPVDPLAFTDTEPYVDRIRKAEEKTDLKEAIVTGSAFIQDLEFSLGVMDFSYLGGSMGSVVGEKVTRLVEYALHKNHALVIVSSSGGARMQEGTFSLMQMVKTGAALARYHEAGHLYISLLTEPTFGGVTASYGTLGDIIIAEEGARIGFAGRRVIEQTIRQKLPADFQTASYLSKYGQVDMVQHRRDLKKTLYKLINLHQSSQVLSSPLQERMSLI